MTGRMDTITDTLRTPGTAPSASLIGAAALNRRNGGPVTGDDWRSAGPSARPRPRTVLRLPRPTRRSDPRWDSVQVSATPNLAISSRITLAPADTNMSLADRVARLSARVDIWHTGRAAETIRAGLFLLHLIRRPIPGARFCLP